MSFIGKDCCIFCGEIKSILIDKRMKESAFPDSGCVAIDDQPCDKCQEDMKLGFTIIERHNNRNTGNLWVLKIEKALESFDKDFIDSCTKNICYIEPDVAKEMGLPYESINNTTVEDTESQQG